MATLDRLSVQVDFPDTAIDLVTNPSSELAIKTPVRVATTANLNLNGIQTIDGVLLVADDRVLVKDQTNAVNNGIYLASSGTWSRTSDFDEDNEVVKGTAVYINDGSVNGGKTGYVAADDPVIVGTSEITFDLPSLNQSITDYGAVGDGIVDDTAAINAAITAVSRATTYTGGSGSVLVPQGVFRITSALNLPKGVCLTGLGGTNSNILCDDCGAVTLEQVIGFGQQTIKGIYFYGVNATAARTAILRHSTNDIADMMYGLNIENCLFYEFDTVIYLRSIQNFTILNCWGQNINQGIICNGFTANGIIWGNNLIVASGNAAGGSPSGHTGVEISQYNYTTSGGVLCPEGIRIEQNQFFKFNIGIDAINANWAEFNQNNIVGLIYGIRFSTVQDALSIRGNNIEMQSATAAGCIYGVAQSGAIQTKTVIKDNVLNSSTGSVSSDGIKINASGANYYQDNVVIDSNYIKNMQGYDVLFYNPGGNNQIINNHLTSTGNTGSILVGTRQTGITIVKDNYCDNTITNTTATDLTNGYIRKAGNLVSGPALEKPTWAIESAVAPFVTLAGPTAARTYTLPDTTCTLLYNGGALGTPASGTLTNCTGLPVGGITGLGSNVAALLASFTSANFAAAVTDEDGTGSVVLEATGTWTPTDQSGAGLVFTSVNCKYTRIGNIVHAYGTLTYPATASGATAVIGGLPFTVPNASYAIVPGPVKNSVGISNSLAVPIVNTTTFNVWNNPTSANQTNANLTTAVLNFNITYPIA